MKPAAEKAGRLSTGMDVVSVERMERAARSGRFLSRVFTDAELQGSGARPERLSSIFAAKEAFLKAVGTGLAGGVRWKDMEVRITGKRAELTLSERASGLAAGRRPHLSVAHSSGVAAAIVVLEDQR